MELGSLSVRIFLDSIISGQSSETNIRWKGVLLVCAALPPQDLTASMFWYNQSGKNSLHGAGVSEFMDFGVADIWPYIVV